MKKLLNTAYVTTEGAALKKDGETLVAEIEGAEKTRIPLHMLGAVVAFRRAAHAMQTMMTHIRSDYPDIAVWKRLSEPHQTLLDNGAIVDERTLAASNRSLSFAIRCGFTHF